MTEWLLFVIFIKKVTMAAHSIIFRSARFPIPENMTADGLVSIIKEDSTEFEYFGEMIDNPLDFMHDESLNRFIDSHTFISLDFDTGQDIDYAKTDAKRYFIEFIKNRKIRIESEGKDIKVFYG